VNKYTYLLTHVQELVTFDACTSRTVAAAWHL